MNTSIFIGRKMECETRTWLQNRSVSFTEKPLIEIDLLNPDLQFLKYISSYKKAIVITSTWAALWLVKNYNYCSLNSEDTIYCISEKQSEILGSINAKIVVSERKNASSLAQKVIENYVNEFVVFLKGNKSLSIIKNEFNFSGSKFREMEVYRNRPKLEKIADEFALYLFFSPSGVQSFIEAGNTIPQYARIVALGATTAEFCKNQFLNPVYVSPVQQEMAAVKCAVNILIRNPLKIENNYV